MAKQEQYEDWDRREENSKQSYLIDSESFVENGRFCAPAGRRYPGQRVRVLRVDSSLGCRLCLVSLHCLLLQLVHLHEVFDDIIKCRRVRRQRQHLPGAWSGTQLLIELGCEGWMTLADYVSTAAEPEYCAKLSDLQKLCKEAWRSWCTPHDTYLVFVHDESPPGNHELRRTTQLESLEHVEVCFVTVRLA